MKTFFNVEDLGDLKAALAEAQEVKANRFGYQELGKNKTLLMIFFNNSLRTRLKYTEGSNEPGHECYRARCKCRCLEAGDRTWRYHGW